MNELLEFEVKERMENERKLKSHIHSFERVLVGFGAILTIGMIVLMSQVAEQSNQIKSLQEQVQANRESVLHQAEVDKRQEVILSKLNQEYQMKHAKKGGTE